MPPPPNTPTTVSHHRLAAAWCISLGAAGCLESSTGHRFIGSWPLSPGAQPTVTVFWHEWQYISWLIVLRDVLRDELRIGMRITTFIAVSTVFSTST